MNGPRIIAATKRDWVFEFRMRSRRTGKEYRRKVGVNGRAAYAYAYSRAVKHVNPPRATAEGRADKLIELVSVCRLHQLPVQQYQVMDA